MAIVNVVSHTEMLRQFTKRTEADLYLWVLDHQHYLEAEEGVPLQPPESAARMFVDEGTKKPARKARSVQSRKKKP